MIERAYLYVKEKYNKLDPKQKKYLKAAIVAGLIKFVQEKRKEKKELKRAKRETRSEKL